jgi:hypothetical protein
MSEKSQALYAEATFVYENAAKYQANVEYLLTVHQLLLDEKPLHLDHLGEFNRHERQLRHAIKRDKKLVKRCRKSADRMMRQHHKMIRRELNG